MYAAQQLRHITARPSLPSQQQDADEGAASEGLNFGHYGVRLCGQDSERGTFNQRHAAMYDQTTGERCSPTCPPPCQLAAAARSYHTLPADASDQPVLAPSSARRP